MSGSRDRAPRSALKPLAGLVAIGAMGYQVGAAGLVTLFPGLGVLGITRGALRQPVLRLAAALALLWSATTTLSAATHGDKMVTQLGMYGVVVILCFAGMWWLYAAVGIRRETVVIIVGLGWLLLRWTHVVSQQAAENSWKYSIGAPITLAVLGLAWRLRLPRVLLIVVVGVLSYVSFVNDSRFFAGLTAALAIATVLHKRGRVTRGSVIRQLAALVVAIVLVLQFYPRLADAGYFGHRAQSQQRELSQEGVNFLFANRPEAIQSGWIAAHHPLLGIGPGTQLDGAETRESIQFLVDMGLPMDNNEVRYLSGAAASQNYRGLGYATHSSAVDSVAHGGVLAAPFWIYFIFLLVRIILTRAREEVYAVPALLWLSLVGVWDALFSPLAATQWPEIALALFLAATAARRNDGADAVGEPEETSTDPAPDTVGYARMK